MLKLTNTQNHKDTHTHTHKHTHIHTHTHTHTHTNTYDTHRAPGNPPKMRTLVPTQYPTGVRARGKVVNGKGRALKIFKDGPKQTGIKTFFKSK